MSGGGSQKSKSTTQSYQTEENLKDFNPWVKPYGMGYMTDALDLSNRQFQPYGGYFQNLTTAPAYKGYTPSFLEADRRNYRSNFTKGPDEYYNLFLPGAKDALNPYNTLDRYNRLATANPNYSPTVMNQSGFADWSKGKNLKTMNEADIPFVLGDKQYEGYLHNQTVDARQRQAFDQQQQTALPPNMTQAVANRLMPQSMPGAANQSGSMWTDGFSDASPFSYSPMQTPGPAADFGKKLIAQFGESAVNNADPATMKRMMEAIGGAPTAAQAATSTGRFPASLSGFAGKTYDPASLPQNTAPLTDEERRRVQSFDGSPQLGSSPNRNPYAPTVNTQSMPGVGAGTGPQSSAGNNPYVFGQSNPGGSIIDYMNANMLGKNIAPWSTEQQQALSGTANIARQDIGAGDTNAEMRNWLRGMFNPNQDTGTNPYLQEVINRAQNDQNRAWNEMVKPRLDATAARSHAFGDSAWSQANAEAERAQGQELGRISEDIRYKDWSDRMQNRLRAAGILGSGAAADSRYRDLAALSGVGEQKQGYAQNLMNEAYQEWLAKQGWDANNLGILGNALNLTGANTGYGHTTSEGIQQSKSRTSQGGSLLGSIGSGLMGLASLPMSGGGSLLGNSFGSFLSGLSRPAMGMGGGMAAAGAGGGFMGYTPDALNLNFN